MAVSDSEFNALKAQVENNAIEILTIKNSFSILEQTVNQRYGLAMDEMAKIKSEIKALKERDESLQDQIKTCEKKLARLTVEDEANKILINRINRERKGLI